MADKQIGCVSYEEQVRWMKANGKITVPAGEPIDEELKGLTLEQVGDLPQPQNKVAPHIKVVLPVAPALLVKDEAVELNVKYKDGKAKIVDFNRDDFRNGGLNAIPHAQIKDVEQDVTVVTHGTVKDSTIYDPEVHDVKVVTSDITKAPTVAAPQTTSVECADNAEDTVNGSTLQPVVLPTGEEE